jgi:hypothetical protein
LVISFQNAVTYGSTGWVERDATELAARKAVRFTVKTPYEPMEDSLTRFGRTRNALTLALPELLVNAVSTEGDVKLLV